MMGILTAQEALRLIEVRIERAERQRAAWFRITHDPDHPRNKEALDHWCTWDSRLYEAQHCATAIRRAIRTAKKG